MIVASGSPHAPRKGHDAPQQLPIPRFETKICVQTLTNPIAKSRCVCIGSIQASLLCLGVGNSLATYCVGTICCSDHQPSLRTLERAHRWNQVCCLQSKPIGISSNSHHGRYSRCSGRNSSAMPANASSETKFIGHRVCRIFGKSFGGKAACQSGAFEMRRLSSSWFFAARRSLPMCR